MSKFLIVLLLIFTINGVYADYWSTYDQNSASQLEKQYIAEANEIAQQKKGIDKTIYELGSPALATLRAYFSTSNNFLGEFIFLLRMILWFSFLVVLQVLVVKVFAFIFKASLTIASVVSFISNSDDIIDAYQTKIGIPIEKQNNKNVKNFTKTLFVLKELIR